MKLANLGTNVVHVFANLCKSLLTFKKIHLCIISLSIKDIIPIHKAVRQHNAFLHIVQSVEDMEIPLMHYKYIY